MIVEIRGLTKVYEERQRVVAVDGIDLSVEQGEIFGLLGPNGAGKTTTISIATTRALPTRGQVTIAGVDVVARPATHGAILEWFRNTTRSIARSPSSKISIFTAGISGFPARRRKNGPNSYCHSSIYRSEGEASPHSFPAACSNGYKLRARSPIVPLFSSSTNPAPGSIRKAGSPCGMRSRAWAAKESPSC